MLPQVRYDVGNSAVPFSSAWTVALRAAWRARVMERFFALDPAP